MTRSTPRRHPAPAPAHSPGAAPSLSASAQAAAPSTRFQPSRAYLSRLPSTLPVPPPVPAGLEPRPVAPPSPSATRRNNRRDNARPSRGGTPGETARVAVLEQVIVPSQVRYTPKPTATRTTTDAATSTLHSTPSSSTLVDLIISSNPTTTTANRPTSCSSSRSSSTSSLGSSTPSSSSSEGEDVQNQLVLGQLAARASELRRDNGGNEDDEEEGKSMEISSDSRDSDLEEDEEEGPSAGEVLADVFGLDARDDKSFEEDDEEENEGDLIIVDKEGRQTVAYAKGGGEGAPMDEEDEGVRVVRMQDEEKENGTVLEGQMKVEQGDDAEREEGEIVGEEDMDGMPLQDEELMDGIEMDTKGAADSIQIPPNREDRIHPYDAHPYDAHPYDAHPLHPFPVHSSASASAPRPLKRRRQDPSLALLPPRTTPSRSLSPSYDLSPSLAALANSCPSPTSLGDLTPVFSFLSTSTGREYRSKSVVPLADAPIGGVKRAVSVPVPEEERRAVGMPDYTRFDGGDNIRIKREEGQDGSIASTSNLSHPARLPPSKSFNAPLPPTRSFSSTPRSTSVVPKSLFGVGTTVLDPSLSGSVPSPALLTGLVPQSISVEEAERLLKLRPLERNTYERKAKKVVESTPTPATATNPKAAYVRPDSSHPPSSLTKADSPSVPTAPPPTLTSSTSLSKLTYERPPPIPGAILPPPGPQVAKKADGALPLSAVEKARSLSAKLTLAFPHESSFHPIQSAHIYLPSATLAVAPPRAGAPAPTEGTLHGFWPAAPSLNSGKGLYPAPLNIPQIIPSEAEDLRPRVDIFVDNSNILYSFLNWVRERPEAKVKEWSTGGKVSKTVTISGQKAKLDYKALFAILERGRKVGKRVLVGSSPLWQSLEVALEWGYEVSILQRVPRALGPPVNTRSAPPLGSAINEDMGLGTSSAKKRSRALLAKPAKVVKKGIPVGGGDEIERREVKGYKEQAVDELLHLKILESLLDHTPPPSSVRPLLVLATGDANSSEYNPNGFLGCVRRALERGWDVEIIAFPCGTSSSWLGEEGRAEAMAKEVGEGSGQRGRLEVVDLEVFGEELVGS